jgi:long-chain acyl-CoA synthetase
MLEETIKKFPEKTAIVMDNNRLSYTELDKASNKMANALIKIGVNKGDRVVILLPNSPEFVIIYFGIIKAGGVAVFLNVNYKVDEIASLFEDSQPRVLVTESSYLESLVTILPRFKSIKHVINLDSNYDGQSLNYRQIMETSSTSRVRVELETEEIANIAYTSGPTIHPRGVMLSHQSLLEEANISSKGFQQTDKDVAILFALPMHHVLGLVAVLLTAINKGSKVVIVSGSSISNVMESIEREKGTTFMGVPYIYNLMIDMAEREEINNDLGYLRLCSSAGAPLSLNTIREFKKYFGKDIIQFYGLTEAMCHITCQPLDGTGKIGSVGKVLAGWECKIVDDSGNELPIDQPGEIIVRGPIMNGYYHRSQVTAVTIKDNWLYTGDIGRMDKDGCLFIMGRKKEIIIVKGENVHPSDIEEILHMHPKVDESVVVGVPDEMRGEVVRAILSLKEGEKATEGELKIFCRKHMAKYKVPRQIIIVDALPRDSNGKIHKEDLKWVDK